MGRIFWVSVLNRNSFCHGLILADPDSLTLRIDSVDEATAGVPPVPDGHYRLG